MTLEQSVQSGYVTKDHVVAHAHAAAFELAGRSEINRNPRDKGLCKGRVGAATHLYR